MNARTQITMDAALQRRAQAKAAELGISFAEYVRRLVAGDLDRPEQPKPDISSLFNLIDEGPPTNIARNKNTMLAEAVWIEHRRKIGRGIQRPSKHTKSRR